MSDTTTTFLDRVMRGDASLEEVDDYVDRWHDGPAGHALHLDLGLTEAEYAAWLRDPGSLSEIVRMRRKSRVDTSV